VLGCVSTFTMCLKRLAQVLWRVGVEDVERVTGLYLCQGGTRFKERRGQGETRFKEGRGQGWKSCTADIHIPTYSSSRVDSPVLVAYAVDESVGSTHSASFWLGACSVGGLCQPSLTLSGRHLCEYAQGMCFYLRPLLWFSESRCCSRPDVMGSRSLPGSCGLILDCYVCCPQQHW